jgi:hypothetical protein
MISILKKLIPAIFIIITAIAMSFASTKNKNPLLHPNICFLFLSVHFSVKRLSEMKEIRDCFHATSNLGMGFKIAQPKNVACLQKYKKIIIPILT